MINDKWEEQKEYKLSEKKTGAIYRQRLIDAVPVFGFMKANLRFTRFSVRGKSKRNGLCIDGSINLFGLFT